MNNIFKIYLSDRNHFGSAHASQTVSISKTRINVNGVITMKFVRGVKRKPMSSHGKNNVQNKRGEKRVMYIM